MLRPEFLPEHFQVTASLVTMTTLEVLKDVRIFFHFLLHVVTSSNMKIAFRNFYVLSAQKISVYCNVLRRYGYNFLHRIKGFVYIAGTKCVYCAVRNESLYMFHVKVFTVLKY